MLSKEKGFSGRFDSDKQKIKQSCWGHRPISLQQEAAGIRDPELFRAHAGGEPWWKQMWMEGTVTGVECGGER